ncbi:MAG TPA: polysaccharide deacetylase family protein [Thermoanaerobaculia bacterium]
MRAAARRLADALLAASPLQPWFERRARRRLTVLAYHGVDDPGTFEAHLADLARRGRPVIAPDTLVAALAGGPPLPPAAVLVTFDDGHASVLAEAAPRLARRGWGAAVFVVAGTLDGDEGWWWEEARRSGGAAWVRQLKALPDAERRRVLAAERGGAPAPPPADALATADLPRLAALGVEVGSHTWSHPILPRCEDAVVREEVERAHARLAAALGGQPRFFAYPNGDFDPRAEAALAALGYRAAFLFDHRLSPSPPPRPFAVSRVRVDSHTPLARFRILTSGLHPALHHRLGRR